MNSLSIRLKILLLLCILGIIGIVGSLYSGLMMQSISSGYSSLIAHETKASIISARAERMLRVVMGTAYSLALETDEAGNQTKLDVVTLSENDFRAANADLLRRILQRAQRLNHARHQASATSIAASEASMV